MSNAEAVKFPCEALPEDGARARLLGVYPQRQEGLFMQRVKLPGGRIAASQLRALASISERCGPDWPLHLTTRQCFELHGLRREDVPAVQREIQAAGLTSLGAAGDTLRNLTVCPGAGR
jgi:sulfite reductase beta subunit-like hemoprotein